MQESNWKFYTSNDETLEAMISACESATKTIELEQFIFCTDEYGNKLIDICAKKASDGVKVRFLWDAAGSFTFSGAETIKNLKEKGIELLFFKTLLPALFDAPNYRSWYFRNHRRSLIIDGKTCLTGSICIDETKKDWRDTSVLMNSPIAFEMQKSFEQMWNRSKGTRSSRRKKKIQNINEFKYINNQPFPRKRVLYRQIVEAIRNSEKYIYITTPYFVPTHRIARVLRLAAHRGVDVRILIPERSDHAIVDLAARTYFSNLLKSKIRIFTYKDRMIHNKTLVIDDNWSSIGTLNIDHISLLYNFEANIISTNKKFTEELKSHFMTDISNSNEVTQEQWDKRYWVEKFAGFFIKFIRSLF